MRTVHYNDPNKYAIGAHLIVERTCFTHHGIYVGSNTVVENLLREGIMAVPVDVFSDGAKINVRNHPYPKFNGLQAVQRALSRLGESSYNLFTFNCEHFVNWCIEGVETSRQVDSALAVLEPLQSITDKLPLIGRWTKEAKMKAMAGHLATNPNDHETSAHFDSEIMIKQFKEDIDNYDIFVDIAKLLKSNVCNLAHYRELVKAEQEANAPKDIDELWQLAENRAKQNQQASEEAQESFHRISLPSTSVRAIGHTKQQSSAQLTKQDASSEQGDIIFSQGAPKGSLAQRTPAPIPAGDDTDFASHVARIKREFDN